MKRPLLFFLFSLFFVLSSEAQEVYNYVLESATRTVNSPTSNYTQTQIAQFKRTALIYMSRKATEKDGQVEASFLDTQAYCMSEFLTLFFSEVIKDRNLSASDRKEKIYTFMKATLENPQWNDPDQATAQSFIQSDELTPFSIDCNWEKALAWVQVQLKNAQ